jgi:hypothetical protein
MFVLFFLRLFFGGCLAGACVGLCCFSKRGGRFVCAVVKYEVFTAVLWWLAGWRMFWALLCCCSEGGGRFVWALVKYEVCTGGTFAWAASMLLWILLG